MTRYENAKPSLIKQERLNVEKFPPVVVDANSEEEIETGSWGRVDLKGSFQNTHRAAHTQSWATSGRAGGIYQRMGYGASPAESSGSPEQIRTCQRCCHSSRRSGKLSPAELGSNPPPSSLRVRKCGVYRETPRFLIPAPPCEHSGVKRLQTSSGTSLFQNAGATPVTWHQGRCKPVQGPSLQLVRN